MVGAAGQNALPTFMFPCVESAPAERYGLFHAHTKKKQVTEWRSLLSPIYLFNGSVNVYCREFGSSSDIFTRRTKQKRQPASGMGCFPKQVSLGRIMMKLNRLVLWFDR